MKELIERIEGAEEGSRGLDAEIAIAISGGTLDTVPGRYWLPGVRGWSIAERYTASLDAAMTLVPEGWDSCLVGNVDDGAGYAELARNDGHMMAKDPDEWWVEAEAATPALALAAAALKARGE